MLIKGFDKNLKCRGYQFEVGKIYEVEGNPVLCKNGFHYCDNIVDVHSFYSLKENNRYCEIEALGEVVKGDNKLCTNKIMIVREIEGEELELLKNNGKNNIGILNSGDNNSGYSNSGNRNSGDNNSGSDNSGDRNSGSGNSGSDNSGDNNSGYSNSGDNNFGDWNSGSRNSGDNNSGSDNSGDSNSGRRNSGSDNSGDRNSGNWNSGLFNSCDYSNGVFCTQEPTINIFNMSTNLTLSEFYKSKYYDALSNGNFNLTEWIEYSEEEKENDENKKNISGYLKQYTYKEACLNWWNSLNDDDKETIKNIPNFDAKIFEEITGIKV